MEDVRRSPHERCAVECSERLDTLTTVALGSDFGAEAPIIIILYRTIPYLLYYRL